MAKRRGLKGQIMIYKTIDWATRTPLNTGVNSDAPERLVASVVLLSAIKRRYQI